MSLRNYPKGRERERGSLVCERTENSLTVKGEIVGAVIKIELEEVNKGQNTKWKFWGCWKAMGTHYKVCDRRRKGSSVLEIEPSLCPFSSE